MSTYQGKPAIINRPASELYNRFSNLHFLEEKIAELPDDQRAKLGEVRFTDDALVIVTPQVGEVIFRVKEKVEPEKVVFSAENSPVPLDMTVRFTPVDADSTSVETAIDVQIPAIMRPLVGPHLQKAADQFGTLMSTLNF